MLVTCAEMQAIEQTAFERGISAEDLMEQAGRGIAEVVSQFFPAPGRCTAYCGKGHNAGDALVAARHLALRGWQIAVRLTGPESDLAPLTAKKFAELRSILPESPRPPLSPSPHLLLDGLLGIGARGAPRGELAAAIREISALRRRDSAFVVALDLPSGLDGDTGEPSDPCVQADLTVTIAHAKTGLVADSATNFVGRLALVPLEDLNPTSQTKNPDFEVSTPSRLRPLLPPRDFDTHKGTWGRVGIVAGSPGFYGAARLCSSAAVHAGAGLVTLYALPDAYPILAATVCPEVMVKRVASLEELLDDPLDALAIGPGIGFAHRDTILLLVCEARMPAVLDADALTIIAGNREALRHTSGPRLLTPHPGEMARLMPTEGRSRRAIVETFTHEYPVTLLLKGARTLVGEGGVITGCNTTGNPGMGSGGMGDALTGVCAALLAGGLSPSDAARLGAWLCGRAAESAVFGPGGSPEALTASDGIAHLGSAFAALRSDGY